MKLINKQGSKLIAHIHVKTDLILAFRRKFLALVSDNKDYSRALGPGLYHI